VFHLALSRKGLALVLLLSASVAGLAATWEPHPAGPQAREPRPTADERLLSAIHAQDLDGVREALRSGANPNGPGLGMPVLGDALAFGGEATVVRELLKAGADPNARATDGSALPMLHVAVAALRAINVDAVLKAGARPDSRGADGLTALAVAAVMDAAGSCDALVRGGADLNSWNPWPTEVYGTAPIPSNGHGRTPLMIAASLGHERTVWALLYAGADTTLKNERGETALDLTREYRSPIKRIREYLRNPSRRPSAR
jgi:hypothetical protein